ncbi:DUF2946 domain-containing protein [Xanthomonas hyacinthi]|uniref:DUF2946 domain-containing protein n=1 Tax=Xanthomonas hyacinthi TaxID=56455 RepID=A0A2S7F0K1_9XANT|nr:DUF2946 family protein [Xanthomonas hyacinthi]KLD78104.1 hypothetical protein Y886_11830 [Xanthomonas hyacinthi DSM 19077]PPU98939.1 DUF2946 domain-containing protein [Xanthomonas hyacinthi]QGY77776.1 DUF2946 domain-containing protein [Xanthomonas hyacinthi]
MLLWGTLAMLAIVLMLAVPLLSRWRQARSGDWAAAAAGALCTSRGLQSILPLPAVGLPAHHAGAHDDGGMLHEQACDYCLLAARLLPLLALLWLVLPWLRQRAPLASPRPPVVDTGTWRAHAARGPPLHS